MTFVAHLILIRQVRIRLQPELAGHNDWINSGAAPPSGLIAAAVDLTMVTPAQRNGEFIAGLTSQRTALHEAEVVSVRWSPTADQTSMGGDKLHMIPVTNPPRFGQR